jgi:hypothetical protein
VLLVVSGGVETLLSPGDGDSHGDGHGDGVVTARFLLPVSSPGPLTLALIAPPHCSYRVPPSSPPPCCYTVATLDFTAATLCFTISFCCYTVATLLSH